MPTAFLRKIKSVSKFVFMSAFMSKCASIVLHASGFVSYPRIQVYPVQP